MYDYVSGHLDSERQEAMDEYLADCSESRMELAALREGLTFCHELSKVEVARPALEQIRSNKTLFQQMVETMDWRKWPDMARWTAEAFLISLVLALMVIFIPWNDLLEWSGRRTKELVLAEVKDLPSGESQQVEGPVSGETEEEGEKSEEDRASASEEVVSSEPASEPAAEPPSEAVASPPEKAEASEPALKGEIYRAFMNLANVDEVAGSVTEKIVALGGEKAGEVPLGWMRPQGAYYHFTLPEANYDELASGLRGIGPVRIFKNPHWRVMPPGQIRFILWLERVEKEEPPPSEPSSAATDEVSEVLAQDPSQ